MLVKFEPFTYFKPKELTFSNIKVVVFFGGGGVQDGDIYG